jgi:hypothetical protein
MGACEMKVHSLVRERLINAFEGKETDYLKVADTLAIKTNICEQVVVISCQQEELTTL